MANFKTSARTVDMLGRQQIAGIPTAINELFKNAFDAYASRVVADFDESRDFFLLRDDGIGMSPTDFINRWLTIGTDSKVESGTLDRLTIPPGARPRPVLGEKGIGRLAIAALGSQTVVLTRPQTPDGQGQRPLTASLLLWRLFEIPGMTLDDISVPVIEVSEPAGKGTVLTPAIRGRLVQTARDNVRELGDRVPKEDLRMINSALDHLIELDLDRISTFEGPSLTGEGHGTHFLVTPTEETLAQEVDPRGSGDTASKLVKLLIGFSNTMNATDQSRDFSTSFFHHRDESDPTDLIGADEFFRPSDFDLADHQVTGQFDERGNFHGEISIFGADPKPVHIPFPHPANALTRCGPFGIRFGYVMGQMKESALTDLEWNQISARLRRIAGLYIYRDGIRVLPYGNSEHDYLNIEERRSKQASRYFFSYRRMFGAVELTSADNPGLQEKAGREGFRENVAYKEMVAILENFFLTLAARYFNKGTEDSEEFIARREELKATERRRRQKSVQEEHRQLRRRFDQVLNAFSANEPEQRVAALIDHYSDSIASAPDPGSAVASAEATLTMLDQIREDYQVQVPSGVGLSRELRSDLGRWQGAFARFDTRVVGQARDTIEAELAAAEDRFADTSTLIADGAADGFDALLDQVRDHTAGANESIRRAAEMLHSEAEAVLARAEADTASANAAFAAAAALDRRARADARAAARADLTSALSAAHDELVAISDRAIGLASRKVSADLALVEEEVLELRSEYDIDLELSQLGRAVEIINHEFGATITSVRSSLQALRPWARRNPALQPIEARLSASFEHLDAYLRLFTPLQRRLQRRPTDVRGPAIVEFIDDLFGDRMARHHVSLQATPAFLASSARGYPSTLLPVFINLVDNALYWLSTRPEPRLIELDAEGGVWVVRDNGPGVDPELASTIFDMSVTTKPGGRGVGLKVSRDVLRRSGWDLWLVSESGLAWPEAAPTSDGRGRHGAEFRFAKDVEPDTESDEPRGPAVG
ncbi:hypothetical protein CFH99_00145 [Nocardioides aromaticivorans]|uniref:Sensor-like histidine kinase SenX3 n=1 Tax=Nocardioides aromaticivorans TaxID=200618 RepID=A0ABX7PDS8_9ACTN|nr:ATP-binding protein [Nocardioides aromaticivorans]QSR24036.1 hypothetical protein CFH99_00145 [Nocardioides aromaticivorans]